MSLMSILFLLLIAAICGGIGQSIAGYSLGGCFVSVLVGFIGAYIGKWIAAEFEFTYMLPLEIGGEMFPIVWTILGSALFSVVIGLITGGRNRM